MPTWAKWATLAGGIALVALVSGGDPVTMLCLVVVGQWLVRDVLRTPVHALRYLAVLVLLVMLLRTPAGPSLIEVGTSFQSPGRVAYEAGAGWWNTHATGQPAAPPAPPVPGVPAVAPGAP